MKKPIAVSVIAAATLLGGSSFAPAQAQDSANDWKPTFYRLTPDLYVNGWPRFTMSYPKDCVEQRATRGRLSGSGSRTSSASLSRNRRRSSSFPLRQVCRSSPTVLERHGQRRDRRERQAVPVAGWHPGPGG